MNWQEWRKNKSKENPKNYCNIPAIRGWDHYYFMGFSDSEGRGFFPVVWRWYQHNDAWHSRIRAHYFLHAHLLVLSPLFERGQLYNAGIKRWCNAWDAYNKSRRS